jgi:hypothetical protein
VETLQYFGLDPDSDDPWQAVGLTREFAPGADVLEERRRTLRTFFSSSESREDWSQTDQHNRDAGFKKLELALNTCQEKLPAILKKLKRKKAGVTVVPVWREPSTLLLEHAALMSPYSIALNLSNLQRVDLEGLSRGHPTPGALPKVLNPDKTKEIYTKLALGPEKIEEVLREFEGVGLLLWVPDDKEQLARILGEVKKLGAKGMTIPLGFVIPFTPIPTCHTAANILDLWGHPILHNHDMVSKITFIKEASKCVFTNMDRPVYTIKNVMIVEIRLGCSTPVPNMLSLKSDLLNIPTQGELIYVDFPAENHAAFSDHLLGLAARSRRVHRNGGRGVEAVGLGWRPPGQ